MGVMMRAYPTRQGGKPKLKPKSIASKRQPWQQRSNEGEEDYEVDPVDEVIVKDEEVNEFVIGDVAVDEFVVGDEAALKAYAVEIEVEEVIRAG
ncbi:hypothetical protein DVH24_035432 [Malus domestica]|uniref:Uncharacterized protein n=1 Tax=Malus domestica TaxID=3750 RepID=A0A498J4X6_MALDO|nr:hypothetical protein DVH24_035432 [Malus domestica]